jgi:hypothetical protein
VTRLELSAETEAHVASIAKYLADRPTNGYHCPVCGRTMLVTHADPGVAPIFLTCRMTEGCGGRSFSLNYPTSPIPAHLGEPTHEWYRPTLEEFETLDGAMREHVLGGGLILREKAAAE